MKRTINVNGTEQQVECPDDMPVLWVLRDLLDMKGTKFGCGKGLCGSCTIHSDGAAIRACVTPVAAVEGRALTTIEGLSENGDHALQQAWEKYNVPQCGYCQPGQVMQAASLLDANPEPTDEDIDAAMSGNLCRCATYQRIRAAIHETARRMEG